MKRVVILAALLLASLPVAADSLHKMEAGTKVSGISELGRVQIVVPPGEWIVMGRRQYSSQGSGTSLPPIADVFLGEARGGVLARAVVASANIDFGPGGGWYRAADCDRKDMLHAVGDRNYNMRDQECWNVNHYTTTLADRPPKHFEEAYRFMDAQGIRRPRTGVGVAYLLVSGGEFFQIRYFFNPELNGIEPAAQDWRNNDWHKDRYRDDSKKVTYVETLKRWGETMLPIVKRGLERKLTNDIAMRIRDPFND